MKRQNILILVASLAVGLGGAWIWAGSQQQPSSTDAQEAQSASADDAELTADGVSPMERDWLRTRSYALELDAEETHIWSGAAGTPLEFEGRLHLTVTYQTGITTAPDGTLVREYRFETPSRYEAQILDHPLLSTAHDAAETFRGQRAWVVGYDSPTPKVYVPPTAPPLFRALATRIVLETHVIPPQGEGGGGISGEHRIVGERAPMGTAESDYQATVGARGITVTRQRGAYLDWTVRPELNGATLNGATPTVEGVHEAAYSPTGVLLSLRGKETALLPGVVVSTSKVDLKLVSLHSTQWPPISKSEWGAAEATDQAGPDAATVAERFERNRAGGLTAESVLDTLATVGAGGRVPNHHEWAWRAVALLRLDPELCRRVGVLLATEATPHAGRALMTDLLAQAGSPAAQQALRSALSSASVQAHPGFGDLVQRLSLVKSPELETVAWVRQVAESPSDGSGPLPSVHPPAAHAPAVLALGALAGHLAKSTPEHAATAQQHGKYLIDALAEAESPAWKSTYLDALGNSGMDIVEPAILANAESPAADVRLASARALRKLRTDTSHDALWSLASDPNGEVQSEAIRALSRRELRPQDWDTLQALVTDESVSDDAYAAIATLLETLAHGQGAEASIQKMQPVVAALVQQPTRRKDARQRIAALMGPDAGKGK